MPDAPEVHYKLPARVYHADADGPRLSQSLATLCVQKSPLHAWAAHPLLGGKVFESNAGDGTIIHSLLLEPDGDDILEIDPSTIMTKDGKPAKSPFATEEGKRLRDDALAAGKIPLLTDVLGAYKYKAETLRQRFAEHGITFDGESEVTIFWTEETPSGPVRCRCRVDHLIVTPDRIRVIDLKTTESANRKDLRAVSWRLGYDIQAAAYVRAVTAAFPEYVGRVDMLFAFGELERPYAVNPVTLNGEFMRLGEQRWERGRDAWAKCLAVDTWTSYEGGTLEPPAWALAEDMAE